MTEMGGTLGQRMLAAIMFTDVVDFSKRVGEDEERALRLVQRDLQIIADLCRRHSGQILKNTGDGYMLLFTSGIQAVECAQAIQRQFAEHQTQMPATEVLRHRIGIHLGDVFMNAGEVMGDGVNIAARLQTEASPGGICITQALYEVVRTRLSLQTVQIGMRQLKNIPESMVVYEVVVGGLAAASRPQAPASTLPVSTRASAASVGPWPWIAVSIGILAVAAAFLIPMLLRRPTPPSGQTGAPGQQMQMPPPGSGQPGSQASASGAQPGGPGGRPATAGGQTGAPGMQSGGTGGQPGGQPPAAAAGSGDKSTYLATRDYAGYVTWMRGKGYEQGSAEQQAELRKYQQFATLFEWIDRGLKQYSEASPLAWTSPRGGEIKVWSTGDGVVIDTPQHRFQTTLGRVPEAPLLVALAAALAQAQSADQNIITSIETFANDNNIPAGPLLQRLRGGRGR